MRVWLLVSLIWLTATTSRPAAFEATEPGSAATTAATLTPSDSPSPRPAKRASIAERLAAARSVKVKTDILGITIDSSLDEARARLDPLASPKDGLEEKKESEREGEEKVLWRLSKTDFTSVFVKADRKDRVTYVLGLLRKGKEIPFQNIGEVEKAPIQNKQMVAWDVVRPKQPLIRVVARGADGKADSITIFLVKRPPETGQPANNAELK